MRKQKIAGGVAALMIAAGLTACGSGTTGGTDNQQNNGGSNSDCGYTWNPCPSGGVQVSANPQPTNGGVGQVSGICHFSIKGPSGDSGNGGSGLRPKLMSKVTGLINLVGIVWGYCTDTIHDFTLDMHVYGGPPGTHNGGTDFTKNKQAHELVQRAVKSPVPGPAPIPYAITMPCIPGLELQLVYTFTAQDDAGNFIGGGPYGGSIVQYTAADCGAVS